MSDQQERQCHRCGKLSLKPDRCPYCGEPYPKSVVRESLLEVVLAGFCTDAHQDVVQQVVQKHLREACTELQARNIPTNSIRIITALAFEAAYLAVMSGLKAHSFMIFVGELFSRVESMLSPEQTAHLAKLAVEAAAVEAGKDAELRVERREGASERASRPLVRRDRSRA